MPRCASSTGSPGARLANRLVLLTKPNVPNASSTISTERNLRRRTAAPPSLLQSLPIFPIFSNLFQPFPTLGFVVCGQSDRFSARWMEGLMSPHLRYAFVRCALVMRHALVMTALLVPLWGAPPPAAACAFDDSGSADLFDGKFVAVQPQASVVYFAILDAIEQGLLDRSAFQPIPPGPSGYWRAVGRLNGLHRLLSAASASQPDMTISLVFIESNLWARFEPGPQGLAISVHTPGARDGDVVVFTSEAGIAAVLDGRLPVSAALDRGLIAIDETHSAAARTRALILAALDAALSPGSGAPVRVFGPAR